MSTQDSTRPQALVTGASSGIGAAFAERLAREPYDLILVARRRERLEALAQQLQQDHSIGVEVLVADLTQADQLHAVEQRIAEAPALSMLVNNAGFGGYMPFVELEPDRAEELIRLQVLAVTRLTRAALPGMIARGHGAVINVSSRLAFTATIPSPPLPKRATYAASKAFINTFSQLLANELEGTGVRVQALCPGVVQTEFHQHVGADPASFPAGIVMTPEDVVAGSLAGLARGEVICVPALEDLDLLAQAGESQRRLFEQSRSGGVAQRYRSYQLLGDKARPDL
jgi:short-subunit dehydrogenase